MAVPATHSTVYSIPPELLFVVLDFLEDEDLGRCARVSKQFQALINDNYFQKRVCKHLAVPERFRCGNWRETRTQWLRFLRGEGPLQQTLIVEKSAKMVLGESRESEEAKIYYNGFNKKGYHQFFITDPKMVATPYEIRSESFCDLAVKGEHVVIGEGWFPGGCRATHVNYWKKKSLTLQSKYQFLFLDPDKGALSLLHGSNDSKYLTLILGVDVCVGYQSYRLEPIEPDELHISAIFLSPDYLMTFCISKRTSCLSDRLIIWKLVGLQGRRLTSYTLGTQFSRPVRLDLQNSVLEIYAAGQLACEVNLMPACCESPSPTPTIAPSSKGSSLFISSDTSF